MAASEATATLEREAETQRRLVDTERQPGHARWTDTALRQGRLVEAVSVAFERLASGDLIFRVTECFPLVADRFQRSHAVSAAGARRCHWQYGVIQISTNEITKASNDLPRRIEQKAATLEEAATALDEISTTLRKMTDGACEARTIVVTALADAEQLGAVVRETIDFMATIETSSWQIGTIVGVIGGFARWRPTCVRWRGDPRKPRRRLRR
jgi:methyl-accepting chemotaxis protein